MPNMTNTVLRAAAIIFLLMPLYLLGQKVVKDTSLVQFSGIVLDGSTDELYPVPYANIVVKDKYRGTYTDLKGFFSIVVQKGDIIVFSAIGYKDAEYRIPHELTDDRYSIVQLMTQDTINLPEAVIFPWPSRDHFKIEFLKMDVTPELQRRATENLANEYLAEARQNDAIVPFAGRESANFYMRQQAREYVYIGQTPPMNIFSPLAWGQFFQSWKNGDFKKKKD
jgi:hypothetical protein